MELKTFTALITIAVNDGESAPNEFDLSVRIMHALEGKHVSAAPLAQAAHVSVIPGDFVMDPFLSLRTTERGGLMTLNPTGHRLQMVKDQHSLLHSRAGAVDNFPHPTQNEGSDTD